MVFKELFKFFRAHDPVHCCVHVFCGGSLFPCSHHSPCLSVCLYDTTALANLTGFSAGEQQKAEAGGANLFKNEVDGDGNNHRHWLAGQICWFPLILLNGFHGSRNKKGMPTDRL
jgi:hypothetical protein